MNPIKWVKKKIQKRSISIEQLIPYYGYGQLGFSGTSYIPLAVEGYTKNVIVYHCITEIAKAVAELPFTVYIDDEIQEDGNVTRLLSRPNPRESYKTFMNKTVVNMLISGNSYILGRISELSDKVLFLQSLRPDRVTVLSTNDYFPYAIRYQAGDRSFTYDYDPETGESKILHIKNYNPLNDIYGLSPIAATMMNVDTHNASTEWNFQLLKNSARPPGILSIDKGGPDAPALEEQQLKAVRDQINEKYAGAQNAGKIPVVDNMMNWINMGFNMAEMEWIKARSTSARDICLAFGYPPFMLGFAEGATFNNMAEAKMSLYEETVIPLGNMILEEIARYIEFYENKKARTDVHIRIEVDKDQVTALTTRRSMARDSARQDFDAGIISLNEARAEGGYDEWPDGDQIFTEASKLPLDFDFSSFDDKAFDGWAKKEGYSKDFIERLKSTRGG